MNAGGRINIRNTYAQKKNYCVEVNESIVCYLALKVKIGLFRSIDNERIIRYPLSIRKNVANLHQLFN